MAFIIGILAGVILPIQTCVNSKFRFKVGSPYLAITTCMVTGMIFMMLFGLIQGQPIWIPIHTMMNTPWWLYLGGIMGAIGFTVNVVLLPHLGAVQTVIMPLFGQIIASMLIDNFGWFNLPVSRFNLVRLIGVIALLAGVILVIYRKNNSQSKKQGNPLPWQLLGILGGFALAFQTSSNGALGHLLHAPVRAAIFSFTSGSVITLLIVGLIFRNLNQLTRGLGHGNRWWIWFGGPMGSIYAFCSLSLAPLIGAGTTIVLTILGNIAGGLVVDKYGLIGTPKRHVGIKQCSGVIIMILGIILIKFF